tara:strand:- start:58 stop:396 length:339 start_codon:yes stop_codon:yes gene_type:complete
MNDKKKENLEKIAFTMSLKPGFKSEYKKRHDEIWPELLSLLRETGIRDYSIFLDEENNVLFAVLYRLKNHKMSELPNDNIMKKWWRFMGDIMVTNKDNSPKVIDLKLMFHMN